MRVDIITIFPEVFKPYFEESIIRIAQKKGKLKIGLHNLRDYTLDKHRKVDDRPFGGGQGMLMMLEPISRAVEDIVRRASKRRKTQDARRKTKIILLSPQGKTLNQRLVEKLAKYKHLILLCGRYEGVDERVADELVDEEISIGDYVLSGGELAAMVLVDAVNRLIPGVLGHKDSSRFESFSDNLLEYPQYTRPADFRGMRIPQVLLSGNHKKIKEWRRKESLRITEKKRPDLLNEARTYGTK
ncbi:MAG: tRNA (guanosine(37)-N1)-methyltransferase TrmD [Omnitrophica WOR_2 bacterium RIFCSPHIGHO2_02_FULL_45_21]|nr:MAG: tRNA (guanosine(37)-N1)-methyltransferase TrmD [Omnitrophica WOR_2 bacterium RIFCSPHIGHO2_02_FULL_45_21]